MLYAFQGLKILCFIWASFQLLILRALERLYFLREFGFRMSAKCKASSSPRFDFEDSVCTTDGYKHLAFFARNQNTFLVVVDDREEPSFENSLAGTMCSFLVLTANTLPMQAKKMERK
jgi:hypothetical protein